MPASTTLRERGRLLPMIIAKDRAERQATAHCVPSGCCQDLLSELPQQHDSGHPAKRTTSPTSSSTGAGMLSSACGRADAPRPVATACAACAADRFPAQWLFPEHRVWRARNRPDRYAPNATMRQTRNRQAWHSSAVSPSALVAIFSSAATTLRLATSISPTRAKQVSMSPAAFARKAASPASWKAR